MTGRRSHAELEEYLSKVLIGGAEHRGQNAADRELYARTKRRLAARSWPSTQHNAEAKTEVIEAILARATAAEHQDDEHSPPRPRQQ